MMHTCTICNEAQSWNPLTDGTCDDCWEKNTLNIVTCGDCGRVFGHDLQPHSTLTCPYCCITEDVSHFPDYYTAPKWNDSHVNIIKPTHKTLA